MLETQLADYHSRQKHEEEILRWLKNHKNSLPTPLYLYSEAVLHEAVASYRALFPDNARGFYALKANPQPALVSQFAQQGIGGEITGQAEWEHCRAAGLKPENILAGGVVKSQSFLEMLCQAGPAAIVIESEAEWERLKQVKAHAQQTRILLRINPGVSFGGLNMAGGSQFGLSRDQALAIAQECQANPRLEMLGLHFYFGSQRLEVDPIIQAVEVVEETIQTFRAAGVAIQVVDLGLGCGVPYLARDKALDEAALREQLHAHWQNPVWDDVDIWFEAGRALVARSGYYLARVIDRKQLHGETFIFLDGGLNVHNPGVGLGGFLRRNPRFHFMTNQVLGREETINLVGNLCTTADTVGTNVTAPVLCEDDLVIIPNAGAYCQTTAMWGFNSQPLFHEGLLACDGRFTPFSPQFEYVLK
ncbi:MAG: alanine racemase [Ardenticatenaceae bacterium]|nr:alanine racemase [Ardenticatenaceae bacterium]